MFNYDLTFEGQWFASFCFPERGRKEILLVKPVQDSEYMPCKVEVKDWNFGCSHLLVISYEVFLFAVTYRQ